MGQKQVVVINHCNAWHDYASFKLIGVVEEEKLEEKLLALQKELGYTDEEMQSFIDVTTVNLNELNA